MGTKNPIGRKAGPGTPPDSDGTRWPYSVARPGGPSTIPAAPASYGPSWLARFEDDYHCVWLGTFEIWIDEFVTPTIRRVEDRDIALGRSFFHPSLKFVRDAAQSVACHRVELAIRIEEPDHSLRLLERLNSCSVIHLAAFCLPRKDDYHCVWLGTFEIWIDEFVTPTIRRVEDRDIALGRSFFHPLLKFVRDAAQSVACHRVELAIRIEEPYHSLRLLERLNQSIQQNAVEAAIVP